MLAMSENIDVFNEATIWCKGKVKTLCREMEQLRPTFPGSGTTIKAYE